MRRVAPLRRAAAALALCAAAGCVGPEFPARHGGAAAPAQMVERDVMAIPAEGGALSALDEARLGAFAAEVAGAFGGGAGVLVAASATGAAERRARLVGEALARRGLDVSFRREPTLGAIVVSGPARRALIPACPNWAEARISHPMDAVFENRFPAQSRPLGCSVDASLAAMAARPGDLSDPPETAGPARGDAAGRAVERYRTTGPTPLLEPFRPGDGL